MKLSNSKAQKFNRCKKAYEFSYVLKLKPKVRKVQLERGSWCHTLLEVYYANDPKKVIIVGKKKVRVGTDWRKAHKALTAVFNTYFEEEQDELGDLPSECERIMLAYLDRYEEEDADYETLAVELDEWVTLPNGDEFNFIIDQVLLKRSTGGVWIRDHKFVKDFMPSGFMLLDAQLARYFWAFKRLPNWKHLAPRLRGAEFNECRTKPPTIPELVYVGKPNEGLTTRANIDTDYHTYLKAIRAHGLNPKDYKEILTRLRSQEDRFFRRTPLPREAPMVRQMMADLLVTAGDIKRHEAKSQFPRTPDRACTWGCEFYEPCTVQLQGGSITDIVDLKFDIKTPREEGK